MGPIDTLQADCWQCGAVVTRQVLRYGPAIIDIAWTCRACDVQWNGEGRLVNR